MSQNTVLKVNSALFVYRQKHNPDPGEGFSGFSNDLCNLLTITIFTVTIYLTLDMYMCAKVIKRCLRKNEALILFIHLRIFLQGKSLDILDHHVN
jgi:hypothetical protein